METELKLLLLEDDPADAELLQRLLQKAGMQFKAVIASDEAEFLEAMKHNGYDAVLADNALPQYSSMEALKLIRSTNPHVAFILVTGTVSEEFAVKVIQQGADDYILKTNLTRLPSAIFNAIEKKRIQREKETAEKEIEKEKEFSISIINSLPGIFFLCDIDGKFLRWNKNFQHVCGYSDAEIGRMTIEYFFTGDKNDYMVNYLEEIFTTGHGETECIFLTKKGRRVPYYLTSKVVGFEQQECIICVGLDISSSKDSETALKELNNELRRVSGHLEKIREEEQARIAREVHDQLGQQLTGLKMDLSWLKKHGDTKYGTQEWQSKLKDMEEMMDEAVHTIRRIASDLRPGILDDFGLVAAMEWYNSEFYKRSGTLIEFDHPEKGIDADSTITIGLFRIYQEALTNIARHAEADKIYTTLEISDNHVSLTIADDGKGFDSHKKITSLGLLGMKERANIMKGMLAINSEPGKGTTIIVIVPLKEQDIE
jgi:two-component system sensor histidine kinase UhpB